MPKPENESIAHADVARLDRPREHPHRSKFVHAQGES
jgi:hypothetical protein